MLGEVRQLDPVAEPADSAVHERLEQRGLPRAVRADQGDVLTALEHELRVLEQLLVARGEVDPRRLDDRPAAPGRLQELEAERAPADARRLDPHFLDPRDLLQLRLSLPRLRPVAESRDEALEPLDVLGLALGEPRLHRQPSRLLLPPDVPLAGEVDGLAAFELEHGRADRLEEPAVVCDEDDRGVERRQLLLEPLDRGHVEMVRRLVEEEQVRLTGEGARQRGAGELAPRERLEVAFEIRIGEPEAAEDARRAVAPAVAACVLEPRLGLAIATQGLRRVIASGHRLLEAAQLLLGGDEVRGARERVLAQRLPVQPRRPLVVERDPRALLPRELAALELGLAHQRPQQRRLAGAVRPGQRQPVAALDLERDAVEERVAGVLLAERGGNENGHAARVVRVLALDIGTSSARARVYDERAEVHARLGHQERYTATRGHSGRLGEFDADELLAVARDASAEAQRGSSEPVDAVAISSFWHSLVCVDASGRPITPVLTWRRSSTLAGRGAARLGRRPRADGLPAPSELLAAEDRRA